MKNRISILATLLLILCVNVVTAQLYEVSLDQKLQNSTLIIEGKVIKSEAFRGHDGHIYTAHDIQAFSILKGDLHDLQDQKFTVVTYGGTLEDEIETWTHLLTLSKNDVGVFFLTTTNRPIPDENKSFCEVYSSSQGFLKYTENDFQEVVAIAPFNYHQKNDLLQNIRQSTGQFTPVFANGDGSPEDVTGVEYSIQNVSLSGNVLDFDIYVEGLWGSYDLTESELLIEYDPTVLGANVQSNGVLSISPGVVSSSPNYSLSVNDINPDRVSINVKALNTGFALYTVSNVAEQLVHIQIASPASGNPDIEFDESSMQQLSKYLDANSGVEAFQQVFAVGKIEDISGGSQVAPIIHSFYPDTLNAGTSDTLTIIGENFDNIQGNSKVEFVNSKAGPNPIDWISPIANEYPVWSDTMIKVIVPSITGNDLTNSAGSGVFRVNKGSTIDVSASPLHIRFSALNAGTGQFNTPPNKALKLVLGNYNGLGGQSIYYESTFKADTNAVKAFERALVNWKCATFVNYIVQEQDSIPNLNVASKVEYDSLPTGVVTAAGIVTVLASTGNTPFSPCIDNGVEVAYNRRKFNIKFNNNLNRHTNTSMPSPLPPDTYDLESRALHELGHAHLLNHSNNPNDLMYFTDLTPPYRRQIMPNDLLGGQHIMTISSSPIMGCQSHMIPLDAENCQTATNTISLKNGSFLDISVFPNPSADKIQIEITTEQNSFKEFEIMIFDILGRKQGSNVLNSDLSEIDISHLQRGIYFIGIFHNNELVQSVQFQKL
jgi:hypothetical protein